MKSLYFSAISFLFFILPLNGQYKSIVFDRISRQEGFNGQSCSCFLQDHLGYIWIGAVGIHKYDGYKFTHHLALPGCKNYPPTRNFYIKKMMEDDIGLITQVSLEVGFNNLSYFNKSFRKMFGVSPTEYARNHRT